MKELQLLVIDLNSWFGNKWELIKLICFSAQLSWNRPVSGEPTRTQKRSDLYSVVGSQKKNRRSDEGGQIRNTWRDGAAVPHTNEEARRVQTKPTEPPQRARCSDILSEATLTHNGLTSRTSHQKENITRVLIRSITGRKTVWVRFDPGFQTPQNRRLLFDWSWFWFITELLCNVRRD